MHHAPLFGLILLDLFMSNTRVVRIPLFSNLKSNSTTSKNTNVPFSQQTNYTDNKKQFSRPHFHQHTSEAHRPAADAVTGAAPEADEAPPKGRLHFHQHTSEAHRPAADVTGAAPEADEAPPKGVTYTTRIPDEAHFQTAHAKVGEDHRTSDTQDEKAKACPRAADVNKLTDYAMRQAALAKDIAVQARAIANIAYKHVKRRHFGSFPYDVIEAVDFLKLDHRTSDTQRKKAKVCPHAANVNKLIDYAMRRAALANDNAVQARKTADAAYMHAKFGNTESFAHDVIEVVNFLKRTERYADEAKVHAAKARHYPCN